MAVRTLWNFVVGRTKTFFKNYNVIERAEKMMESDKRSPPRHPGTEAKFKVLIKERPEIQEDLDKKHVELLDRLKVVKVSSRDCGQDNQQTKRPLPQARGQYVLPTYGYEEPASISEGKCSLRQALEFITNHQNDPTTHTFESIAATYKMKPSDVEQVIKNFRAFQIYISQDKKIGFSKSDLKNLGINKIIHPLYKGKFSDVEAALAESTTDKKK